MEVREPSARYLTDDGTQRTEIGALPKDWSVVPLTSLAEKIMVGIASAATHAYRSTGVPMFRNQNIRPGLLDTQDVLYIDPQYEQTYKNKRLKAGDLLTARTGYPGTTSLVPAGLDGAQSFTTLITRPRPGFIDPQYLCLYINGRAGQRYFEQAQIGGGQKNVNAASLKLLPVALPSTDTEQRAIARALIDADGLIHSLEQLLTKKRQIKQGAMQELLTGKRRLLQGDVAWRQVPLGSLGKWSGGMTPSMARDDYWSPAEVPWLSSGDLKTAQLSESAKYVSKAAVRDGTTTVVPAKSVVVVMRSGILRKYLPVGITLKPMAINQDLKAIQPNTEVTAEFMLHALTYWGERILATCLKAGTTVESIELRWLKTFTIDLPPVSEQVVIAGVLSEMDSEITALESRLAKARSLKQAMAQALLTGRIRLVEPTA